MSVFQVTPSPSSCMTWSSQCLCHGQNAMGEIFSARANPCSNEMLLQWIATPSRSWDPNTKAILCHHIFSLAEHSDGSQCAETGSGSSMICKVIPYQPPSFSESTRMGFELSRPSPSNQASTLGRFKNDQTRPNHRTSIFLKHILLQFIFSHLRFVRNQEIQIIMIYHYFPSLKLS
jgi:hypothetical protein